MAILIKTIQQSLHMVKIGEWLIRINPAPYDLANKQYLLSIMYSYSICLFMNECLLNIFTRTLLDSVISYHYSLLFIIMIYLSNKKCTDVAIRFIIIVNFLLNVRYLNLVLLVVSIIGSLSFFICTSIK